MSKDLILVESPTKARTLTAFLKGKYAIEASMGHIRDLPKSKLGVDIEHDFEPQYIISVDKKKQLKLLKERVKDAATVILATDPDREGEAISFHLKELLKSEAKKATFKRIVFHEITKEAIEEALANPHDIDMHLVEAQTARRILDRIVGYKLSPLLWKKVKAGLSAGRVQSVALRLIVEREREIEKFQKEEYFRVFVNLSSSHPGEATTSIGSQEKDSIASLPPSVQTLQNDKPTEFELIQIGDEKVEVSNVLRLYDGEYKYAKTIIGSQDQISNVKNQNEKEKINKILVEDILKSLNDRNYTVSDVITKESRRSPYPPFITSTLQVEGARRFGFTGKRTMSTAQKLYEEGFITYHRTDSFNLSSQFITAARNFVEKQFGEKYLVKSPRVYKTKSKNAQEAHEAIRPTKVMDLEQAKAQVGQTLGADAARIYELIYKRAVATQMSDALFESTTVLVTTNDQQLITKTDEKLEVRNQQLTFKASGSVLLFDGYLKLWFFEESDNILPKFTKDEVLKFVSSKSTNHSTMPPPRYNEASLIGSLEKNGIGRPSTYATIVGTIAERYYVERVENRFTPTSIGISVNDFLVKNFASIDDIPFTAKMEDELDTVAEGKLSRIAMMKEFYEPFEKNLKTAEESEHMKVELEKTGDKCPLDGGAVVIRIGKFGKFLSCENFPDCKYTAPLVVETNFECPKCKEAGRQNGKVVAKKTRRGKIFYGCSNYPACDFAVWKLDELKKDQPASATEQKTS